MKLIQLSQSKLEEVLENTETLFEIDLSYSIEIDKSWGGLKFILSENKTTNSADLSKLISSGQEIEGVEDIVSDLYEVNFLKAEQVKTLTIELIKLTDNDISEKFNIKKMNKNDVYGNPFDSSSLTYFLEYLEILKKFYIEAMENKKAVISYIS